MGLTSRTVECIGGVCNDGSPPTVSVPGVCCPQCTLDKALNDATILDLCYMQVKEEERREAVFSPSGVTTVSAALHVGQEDKLERGAS